MIRILLYIAVVALLTFGGAWLLDQPGEVAVTVPGQGRITTTLLGAAAAVAALVVATIFVWTVLRLIFRLPSIIGLAGRARKRARGYAAVSRGMVAVGAGDPRSARRYAEDAGKLLGDEPLALLLKAQAAQMAGDRNAAEGAFKRMLDDPETRVLGLRGLFVEARRKGDGPAARAYAAEAARLSPTVSWAGEALLEYQCADGDWASARGTLDRGARGLDKAMVRRHRAVLLVAEALDRSEREPEAALGQAREALRLAPGLVPAAALAGRLLSRRGELRKAAKVVEQAWMLAPHPDLAAAYLDVRPGDSALDRLARAERLLSLRPHEAESRIAVAGAALGARDFARARAVLAPLLEGRPSVRVCLLMADLEDQENDASGAVREWLARASWAPRDAAWIADGVITDRWAPISPVTGRLDAFVWGTPIESLEPPAMRPRRRPEPAPVLPPSDHVLADVDEPEAPVLEATAEPAALKPAEAPAPPPAVEPAPTAATPAQPAVANAPEPPAPAAATSAAAVPAPVPPAPSESSQAVADSKVVPLKPDPAEPARPRRAAADVVFPMATAPDDPGPDRGETPSRGRTTFLQ